MSNNGLEAKLEGLLKKQKEMSNEIANSEVISIKEWESYSKDRQDSIIMFVHLACEDLKGINPNISFDEETKKYMAKNGIKKILKNIENAF